jgi:hypothetical protein
VDSRQPRQGFAGYLASNRSQSGENHPKAKAFLFKKANQ